MDPRAGLWEKRNKAVQAFWAMHVEALNWSGVSAKDYAAAHHISVYSLRTWRARLDADPLQVDWRARLHPSVRVTISSDASSAAKEQLAENSLTDAATAVPARDRRSNRRSFTDAEKLAIVMEAEQPGASAAAVCRRHDIATSMIFRWRVQFGVRQGEHATRSESPMDRAAASRPQLSRPSTCRTYCRFPAVWRSSSSPTDARSIGSDPDAVRKHVAELENA